MDPVTLIVTALIAGTAAGTTNVATAAVTDLYNGVKAGVTRLLAGREDGELALARLESKPDRWKPILEAELVEAKAADDDALVQAAQRLMALLDKSGSTQGKYKVDLRGARGVLLGDHSTQTNIF